MTAKTNLQALLLDVDGTLADTEGEGHLPAFNQAFEAHGLPHRWDAATYRRLLAAVPGGRERLQHALEAEPPPAGLPATEALARQLHETKNRLYAQRLRAGHIPPRPGVERIVAAAAEAGVRLAVVTTSARANVEALFESVLSPSTRAAFELMITADEVATKKPAPDAYQAALAGLALPAEACLAVEDSANGLQAALAAGIPTLITRNTWTREEDFTGAAAVIDHLDDDGSGTPVSLGRLAEIHARAVTGQ